MPAVLSPRDSSNAASAPPSLGCELPAITNWQDFSDWCRRHGRPSLPASEETLALYWAYRQTARRHTTLERLGRTALRAAAAGLSVPVLLPLATVILPRTASGLAILVGAFLFLGLQLLALGTGWTARSTPAGRAGTLVAALSLTIFFGLLIAYFSGARPPLPLSSA